MAFNVCKAANSWASVFSVATTSHSTLHFDWS